MVSAGGDDVDAESANQAKELRLLRESTDHKTQMRGVGGELPEGRVDRYPVPEKDFRPRVVVKLPAHIGETGRCPRRDPEGPSQGDVQLRMLVAVACSRTQDLGRDRKSTRLNSSHLV